LPLLRPGAPRHHQYPLLHRHERSGLGPPPRPDRLSESAPRTTAPTQKKRRRRSSSRWSTRVIAIGAKGSAPRPCQGLRSR